ncbi:MAG: hypothetical protein ABSB35_27860 [Bryobacteraceae bacterium]|jgi:hypothetical protein
MSDPQPKDRVEEEKQSDIKKTPEYRRFRKLLKQVVKSPPLRKIKGGLGIMKEGEETSGGEHPAEHDQNNTADKHEATAITRTSEGGITENKSKDGRETTQHSAHKIESFKIRLSHIWIWAKTRSIPMLWWRFSRP